MKILLLNSSDIRGGAAIATHRLYKSLENYNVDLKYLVQDKHTNDNKIITTRNSFNIFERITPGLEQIPVKFYSKRLNAQFSTAFFGKNSILNKIKSINPDIIHINWINGGMLSISQLSKIEKPIIWTFHDMWPFTGGCHYDIQCGRFKNICGKCKVLKSNSDYDLSSIIHKRKILKFSKIKNLNIVTVSNWLKEKSLESKLFSDYRIKVIYNTIDSQVFVPKNKSNSRKIFNFKQKSKLVLYGAFSATKDERKGYHKFIDSIKYINDPKVEFVIFGSEKYNSKIINGFKFHFLGNIFDEKTLINLYNAVDVTIVPSMQEAFGQVATESMACGTPVVAFNYSGLKDIIVHKKNGFLAKPFDSKDLAHGINWVLNNKLYNEISSEAVNHIKNKFDYRIISKEYIKYYKKILKSKS